MAQMRLGGDLTGVNRCPHCSVASPQLAQIWVSQTPLVAETTPLSGRYWAAYKCSTCAEVMLARCAPSVRTNAGAGFNPNTSIDKLYPAPKKAHDDIPQPARNFLQQAYDTLHAPDAAAVMAGSAVDAMLKSRGLTKDTLYSRIDKALEDHILTQGMADWAHSVRLGSNRPRHADVEKPHVTAAEAVQSVEFAEALGNFLFVLTARIDRGLVAAGAKTAPKSIKKESGSNAVTSG